MYIGLRRLLYNILEGYEFNELGEGEDQQLRMKIVRKYVVSKNGEVELSKSTLNRCIRAMLIIP